LTGSLGQIDQYKVLLDLCGKSPISGSAELIVKANVDGAHVFIDGKAVGIVSKDTAFTSAFETSGVHLVEVRKQGYQRWGELVTLKKNKRKEMQAKLKKSRYYESDFMPLANLRVHGPEAFSDTYLFDFFYHRTYTFKVNTILVGYLSPTKQSNQVRLNLLSFRAEELGSKLEGVFDAEEFNSYYPLLTRYWKGVFRFDQQPSETRATQSRLMPTLFKVE
jgi:hypothetical protein